ncbi:MAG: AMP-binding protein [Rickettsiales bacterium]|jgi:long-chain acyl-CoA synthetase|nr:AMP-binding protein [Rickettsiales bacterium]
MNMYQFLELKAGETPDNLFLTREKITYAQFLENIKKRAATLKKAGITAGDTVGLLAHNIPEFPLVLFAIWYLGGKCLLMDTNLTPFEYDNMTKTTECKFVVAEKSFFYNEAEFKFIDICAADDAADAALKPYPSESTDIATLSFTSGSTGTPKIVPLTHFNLIECAHSLEDMSQWLHKGDTLYGFLPLYHVFGFAIGFLATIYYNANILLQPTVNPTAILADFKEFRPQIIPAVPRLWEVFRNKIIDTIRSQRKWWLVSAVLKYQKTMRALGLGFLIRKVQRQILDLFGGRARLLVAGGAATKPEVEIFYERLGLTFIQGYGLTETVGPVCISKPMKRREAFAFGAPITNNECEIRDKNEDGVGVLWLKGHQVFGGYLNNPQANEGVFDDRGFFNTGDMVTMDKNGELHFAGRKKNVIVLDSGKNVYNDELEALFMANIPDLKNVAVFEYKIKDKTVVYAVFSVEDGMTMDKLEAAVAATNRKVASYKWVTHFALTKKDLPITSTQKIKHHEVRRLLDAGEYPAKHN